MIPPKVSNTQNQLNNKQINSRCNDIQYLNLNKLQVYTGSGEVGKP